MNFFKKMFEPGWRFVYGFCIIIVAGPLSIVFPPSAFLVFFGGVLILYALDIKLPTWFESDETINCIHCGEASPVRLVRCKHYMIPLLPFIGVFMRIPYKKTYYKICGKCLENHVGELNFNTIEAISAGGLATVETITKEEFEKLLKKA